MAYSSANFGLEKRVLRFGGHKACEGNQVCRRSFGLKGTVLLFSLEGKEPPHIHVEQAARYAKLWLDPVSIARAKGFRSNELTDIIQIVQNNKELFKERWHEHFGHKV